jgi:hypothetical protein
MEEERETIVKKRKLVGQMEGGSVLYGSVL